jgi:hypothetical protein
MPELGGAQRHLVGIAEVTDHLGNQNINGTIVTFLQFHHSQFVIQLKIYPPKY